MTDKRKPSGPVSTEAMDDAVLAPFFEAARETAPLPSAALIERILDDAALPNPTPAPPVKSPGLLARLLAAIGGWPAAAGLAAAAITGVTIGVATPDLVESLSGGYLSMTGTAAEDFMPSYAALFGEG